MKLKPVLFFGFLAILIILTTFFSILSFDWDEKPFSAVDVLRFMKFKNQLISLKVGSPFYRDASFDSLAYYPVREDERFQGSFYPIKDGDELDLYPDRPGYPSHRIAGYSILEKNVWSDTLFILKDLEETSDTMFFVPFTDPGNGKETYGGGRYLDLVIKPGKTVVIDFNFAYNPYCAYNEEFVCARIPSFNILSRKIEAGEKDYPMHKK